MSSSYDPSVDVCLAAIGRVNLGDEGKAWLEVSVQSYDGGEPKVSVLKCGGKWKNTNIGRLPVPAAAELAQLLTKAAEWLEEQSRLKPAKKTVVKRKTKAA